MLKKHSQGDQLKAEEVLDIIPDDWDICSQDYNLLQYFSNMFDHKLTIEENTKISSAMSKMETINSEKECNELKSSYVVIRDDSMCKACDRKLSYKFIRIYPNGGVFHSLCAKETSECPITRQRFDQEHSVLI